MPGIATPSQRMRIPAVLLVAALLATPIAGCGDDESERQIPPPTIGETDAGATGDEILTANLYEVLSSRWLQLSPADQLETVERFIAENEEACLEVEAESLHNLARAQIGVDYDHTTPIGDVLLEGCAISRDGA